MAWAEGPPSMRGQSWKVHVQLKWTQERSAPGCMAVTLQCVLGPKWQLWHQGVPGSPWVCPHPSLRVCGPAVHPELQGHLSRAETQL